MRRRMARTVAVTGVAVVLVAGALEIFGGSVDTSVSAPTRSAPLRATTEVYDNDYCSFLAPCSASPDAVHVDDVARATIEPPSSPNPNACWYCLIHGVEITYGQWYTGLDYAHPVASLKIADASSPPVLHLTSAQLHAALVSDGYDLDAPVTVHDEVCVPGVPCAASEVPMDADGFSASMSGPARPGETWEVVPIVAERAYAQTDNSWKHLGETRTSGEQKVLIGVEEVVLQ